MSVPQDKQALLHAIETNFAKLMPLLEAIELASADDIIMEGHAKDTRMSVANLASYLVGWNELVLKWLKRDAAGKAIDFPETGYKWNELGRLAGKFYKDYEDVPYPELLQRLRRAKGLIVDFIGSHDDQTLYGRSWYGKWTMGRMIQLNTASPYANARARLRKVAIG